MNLEQKPYEHRITSETTLLRHGYLAHTGASQWQRTIFQGGAIQPEHWQRNPEPEKIVQFVWSPTN